MSLENAKRMAGEYATTFVEDGMIVGLGTGSTISYFLKALAEKIKKDKLDVVGIPTSKATEEEAHRLGIPLSTLNDNPRVDVTIDGADEVDKKFNLIKGKGGALTREKIVASASEQYIVVVDESKVVAKLGTSTPVPVEVIPFAQTYVAIELRELEGRPRIRENFTTDNGNIIIDVELKIKDPLELEGLLNNIPGVVENGIFAMTTPHLVVVGYEKEGVKVLES